MFAVAQSTILLHERVCNPTEEQFPQLLHDQVSEEQGIVQRWEVAGDGVYAVGQSRVLVQVLFCVPHIEHNSQSPQDHVSSVHAGSKLKKNLSLNYPLVSTT